MNTTRWIALHCGDDAKYLIKNHPNAFLLLTQIAVRAKWKDSPIENLRVGQAFIGDWKEAGLESEMAYRHAKKVLSKSGLATFQGTSKGTIATLVNSGIYSLSPAGSNDPSNMPVTNQQRTRNGQRTTNHTDTQIDGYTDTIHRDSNSEPAGSASIVEKKLIDKETALQFAVELHEAGKCDQSSSIGFFPPEEVKAWAAVWHAEYISTGGCLKGSRIRNPKSALEAYLMSTANNQSKRFRELASNQ